MDETAHCFCMRSSSGTIGSEAFTILGSSGTSTGTKPEPGTLILFGSGILGLSARSRRKLF